MGKRGPQPRGEFENKTEVFSTRIRPDTKRALEEAAKAKGRSLSQEVEYRLRRSFDQERSIVDHLGGPEMYAVLRVISSMMEAAGVSALRNTGVKKPAPGQWRREPYAFDQALRAAVEALEQLRPPGDPSPPRFAGSDAESQAAADRINRYFAEMGSHWTLRFLEMVAAADPAEPLPSDGDEHSRLATRIKADLGDLAQRIKPQLLYYPKATGDLAKNWKRIKREKKDG